MASFFFPLTFFFSICLKMHQTVVSQSEMCLVLCVQLYSPGGLWGAHIAAECHGGKKKKDL